VFEKHRNLNLKKVSTFLCHDVNFTKTPKENGDGAEPLKMAISKPIPMVVLKIRKKQKKMEKKTVIAQVTPEVTPIN